MESPDSKSTSSKCRSTGSSSITMQAGQRRRNSSEVAESCDPMNAIDRRSVWKNTSAHPGSLKDSLLANSSLEDTLCSSFDSKASVKDRHRLRRQRQQSSSLDINGSKLLKVPSPSGRQTFYSTSPSTDEGIVTDDLEQVEDLPLEQHGILEQASTSLIKCKSKVLGASSNNNGNNTRSTSSILKSFSHRTKKETNTEKAASSSDSYDRTMNQCDTLHDEEKLLRHHQTYNQPQDPNINECNVNIGQGWKRYNYLRHGQSMSDDAAMKSFYRLEHNSNSIHVSRRPKQQLIRRNTDSTRFTIGGSLEKIQQPDFKTNRFDTDKNHDKPNPEKSQLVEVQLMENRASENTKHQLQKSIRATNNERRQVRQDKCLTENQYCFDDTGLENQGEVFLPKPILKDKNDNVEDFSKQVSETKTQDEKQSTACSDKEMNNSLNTASRAGSTKSAIADALSSAVVATATGSLIPESTLTAKEKQKSLTERLMTVGPCDQRRVQGIVEDILCEMGEERIVQYKNAFAKFDKDSSGIISSKQLRQLLRTLGHNPSDIVLRELVNQVDMDENGKIDFNEFIIMIGYFDKANNEDEDLSNIFRVFDSEDRGCIDVNELRNIWNNFLQGMAPGDEFEEMIRVVDNDGNGEINRIELLEILSTR